MTASTPHHGTPRGGLSGRTVLVTGATSGIGRAAALAVARQGARVVLVGRDPERLRTVTNEVARTAGPAPDAFRADFAELRQVRDLGERLRDRYPRIDVMASNAGGMFWSRTTTQDGFEATIQVNHLAGFLTTGGYYSDRRLSPVSGPTADAGLAAKLWEAGAAAVGDTAH